MGTRSLWRGKGGGGVDAYGKVAGTELDVECEKPLQLARSMPVHRLLRCAFVSRVVGISSKRTKSRGALEYKLR